MKHQLLRIVDLYNQEIIIANGYFFLVTHMGFFKFTRDI